MENIGIRDIVDIEQLQELQDNFAEVTRLAVVAVDYKGDPITAYSNFTKFCSKFREDGRCRRMCFKSDAHGGVEAARTQKPHIYRCHTGLVDFAVPILFEGQYLGSILAGQVKVHDNRYRPIVSVDDGFIEAQLAADPELKRHYDAIEVMTAQEVESAAKLMYVVANHIVEQAFNRRIQEVLVDKNSQLLAEMERRMSLEKNLKESELKLLQSQVNPHFLFNVLNTINSLAVIEEAGETSKMIYALSDMLRYTIQNKMHYMVTLEEELDYNNKYLQIQKTRLGDRIDITIDIDPNLKHLKVPFMFIQPIVSNAIEHGLFEMTQGAALKVSSKSDVDNAYIIVEDNGKGIPKAVINQIMAGTYKPSKTGSAGTGLTTVDRRFVHRFGDAYHLKIESPLNRGTRVTVKIPKD